MASSGSEGELKRVQGLATQRCDSHGDRGHMSSREIHVDGGLSLLQRCHVDGCLCFELQVESHAESPREGGGEMTTYLYIHMENNGNLF